MESYKLDALDGLPDNAYLYLSTGALTKMHTLRVYFEELRSGIDGQYRAERDWYLRNISTDADKALEKANKFSEANNIRLINDGDLLELAEIRRRSSEQKALDEAEKEEAFQATQRARETALMEIIDQGIFPYGKHNGETFEGVYKYDKGYLVWMVNNKDEELDAVSNSLKNALLASYPNLKVPEYESVEYFGEPKTRYKGIKAKVVGSYGFDGFYGWVHIEKLLTENGEVLVYMGASGFEWDVSDDVIIDFTVKSHEEYEGEIQTKILRIKLIEIL